MTVTSSSVVVVEAVCCSIRICSLPRAADSRSWCLVFDAAPVRSSFVVFFFSAAVFLFLFFVRRPLLLLLVSGDVSVGSDVSISGEEKVAGR